MIDVDELLRSELNGLVVVEARPDWNGVVAASGLAHERARGRLSLGGLIVVVLVAVCVATPLGAALARSLGGFSAWLSGEPGSPATPRQQAAFDSANAHSWLGFPPGTKLRRLTQERFGGVTVELLGFRAGSSSLCLRILVEGRSHSATERCASLADLRSAGVPVRAVIVDEPFGKGTKVAWYGTDRVHSANLQITAGITADGVRSVVVRDDQGTHRVRAHSNAFLYVARRPAVGQRVTSISAVTAAGVVPIPFAPSPFGLAGGAAARPAAPVVRIERHVHGGTIGWLERRDPRGRPLSVLPPRLRAGLLGYRGGAPGRTRVAFGRVLAPDPSLPQRIALTLNAHHAGGRVAGICTTLVGRSGAGGGCAPYPGVFDSSPISVGVMGDGPGEFATAGGVVSDDVAHVVALLADGRRLPVRVIDNTFIVTLSRTTFPARLVASDRQGRVIGASYALQDFVAGSGASPARGRATQLLAVHASGGAHAELLVGRSTTGGECFYVRHFVDSHHAGESVSCQSPHWTGPALQVSTESSPPLFVDGRVRPDVRRLRLRYADGTTTIAVPTRGYVLQVVPAARRRRGHELVAADALASAGRVVGRESFRPPRR